MGRVRHWRRLELGSLRAEFAASLPLSTLPSTRSPFIPQPSPQAWFLMILDKSKQLFIFHINYAKSAEIHPDAYLIQASPHICT